MPFIKGLALPLQIALVKHYKTIRFNFLAEAMTHQIGSLRQMQFLDDCKLGCINLYIVMCQKLKILYALSDPLIWFTKK